MRSLPPEACRQAADSAPARDPLPVTIGRVELARGNVNFSDFFVRPNYSANLTDVTGSVTTMSAEQAGDIAISARVDHTAPVEVSGRIHPFAQQLSLDIRAKARDVDLPPLTPYSVKYAGYGIEKGKLTFDVHYRVENRKLVAENRLVLDQLTFNTQRIDSPTATKLPVLLAVSLLKDMRGVIDIQLPIAGSLDDPKFSVGGLIIQVIVNLIAKAVTAPFALLASAFGGGEELSTVPFAPGSAALDEEAQKRLETLGKALADRPALKLDIGGRADPESDREALRRAAVESAMKHEKMKSLASAGNAPASVDLVTIGAEERVRWLTAAYRESSIKDRPRNVIGMLKELPPAEMEAMLLADAKVDDDALRLLANRRAQAVKDELAAKSIATERLFLTVPRLSGEAGSASAAAVSVARAGQRSRVACAGRPRAAMTPFIRNGTRLPRGSTCARRPRPREERRNPCRTRRARRGACSRAAPATGARRTGGRCRQRPRRPPAGCADTSRRPRPPRPWTGRLRHEGRLCPRRPSRRASCGRSTFHSRTIAWSA